MSGSTHVVGRCVRLKFEPGSAAARGGAGGAAGSEAAGGEAEYFEYPGDNHNLANSLSLALERTVAFFDQYVKNAAP